MGLLSLTMFGCATSSVDAPGRSSSGVSSDLFERQVMVTFPTTSHFLVRRSIQELSVTFELRMVASWTMESLGQQCVVFEVPEIVAKRADAMDRLVQSLSRDHRIELAQRVQRFSTRNTLGAKTATNDGERSSYRRFQHAADLLRLDAAHSLATGRGVRVAVIDTGMDLGHPEYGRRIVEARDFVGRDQDSFTNDLHGTAVAGLIAARHDDGVGIVGVAPEADLVAIKACWPEPAGGRRAVCNSYTLALALDYAVSSEAEVINLSLGGPDDPILRRLVEAGLQRHTVVVAANGGDGADFPAIVPGVLDVRALPRPDEPREETADLETTWLSAPGHEILTTVPGGYDFWNGSSMAAAQVSGVAALLLEHRPDMTPEEVTILLRDSSRDNPGHGVVDACAAVSVVAGRACGQSGN
ncbi:MAG: S8 family serine peptidase [Thermoanaerobaculia bacterium]|nr:S8 family serine peptidase [Thermoanaerobaculia bacterium]